MKIFNYMNNTNSIMEKNTDKVQKGNSQTNEKHTVGQSVKLSISNEGLEYYRNRIQQSGQEKYDDVVQRKELLASKKISDIDYSYEIQKKAAQQNQNVDTGKSALNITDNPCNFLMHNHTGQIQPNIFLLFVTFFSHCGKLWNADLLSYMSKN